MAKFVNKTERVHAFGEKYSIPGADPIELTNDEVKIYGVDAMVKDGVLEKVAETATPVANTASDLDSMTVKQLQDYAASKNIDISKVTAKDDILTAIKAAEAK